MGEMLSQAEVEALLNGSPLPDSVEDTDDMNDADKIDNIEQNQNVEPADGNDNESQTENDKNADGIASVTDEDDDDMFNVGEDPGDIFNSEEVDALGEIGNISMGNSATTLFALLGKKVSITTPTVSVSTLNQVAASYRAPLVVVKVEYTEGLTGSNLLILKEVDVLRITDLMMNGDGMNIKDEINDLHLSAISEAMNQMIGNASTSLSNVFEMKIDISPPRAVSVKINEGHNLFNIISIDPDEKVAVVSFHMIVEGLLDTNIMQIQPLAFAKEMIKKLIDANNPEHTSKAGENRVSQEPQQVQKQQQFEQQPVQQPQYVNTQPKPQPAQYVNVQPANFQPFEGETMVFDKKNIGLVMDVPLEVSVELGRTQKLIKDILEFGQGSIIELDRLAGEPVDILVNGKVIAKGEVVVIDESFGVRVVDIIHPSRRI